MTDTATTPAPKPKKPQSSEQTIALFQRNLAAIREWYRIQPDSGHELGHLVILEMMMANVLIALEFAIKGEVWNGPPTNQKK